MRTVVHLSDLHFGRVDPAIIAPFTERITAIRPDLIAVSGDLTQRARRRQFQRAAAFLDSLPFEKVIVPGNHDVPFFNLPARLFNPFGGYRRWISPNLEPAYVDDEVAVIGLNSARALITRGRGRLNDEQIAAAVERMRRLPPAPIKVIVTHHPFDLPEGFRAEHLLGRASVAMKRFAEVGADLFLAGHLHVSHIGHTADRYNIAGHSALVVQAGTLSTRGRGELNSFNVLRIARPKLTIERYTWKTGGRAFDLSYTGTFRHTPDGWTA